MKQRYELTEDNVASQIVEISARLDRLLKALSARQLNWQPEEGKRWSIGQCLDHVTKAADVYSAPIASALVAAPAHDAAGARPNPLGRAFIWFIEPPPRFKTPAPKMAQPASAFDVATVRADFERGVSALQTLTARAVSVDAGRTRFSNPFAGGRRVFNLVTGIMVMLAHARRHLLQAEQVKKHPDFPST